MDAAMSDPDPTHLPTPQPVLRVANTTAAFGNAAVVIWNDVEADGVDEFYRWHNGEHIPERLGLPGFLRGRRYICPGHSPEWLTVYEAETLGAVTSPEYLARLNAPTPATMSALKHFRKTSRAICSLRCTVGSSTGGAMLSLRIDMPDTQVSGFAQAIHDEFFPAAMKITGVLACHLYQSDQSASHTNTAESSTRTFDVPTAVLLLEATNHAAAEAARRLIEGPALERFGVRVRPDAAIYQLEICRLAQR